MRAISILTILSILVILGVMIMSHTTKAEQTAKSEQAGTQSVTGANGEKITLNPLTPEEERVILHKGTERPHTGEYDKFTKAGTYVCKRCGAPLYRSTDKFDAGCGWPSFDDEIAGAVKRTTDADGMRTEITCARCGAHLGHVFVGEHLTKKDTRHCVNSISLKFIPAAAEQATTQTALFAEGCFWGSQYIFDQAPGVIATRVGYAGGHTDHPTYKQVCSGTTGHAEAVEVTFDPTKTSYEALTRLFFESHDPTQFNRQGPDVGEQYRSVIFYKNDEQRREAEQLADELRKKGIHVATHIEASGTFWPAEEYHQKYYQKSGGKPYCHIVRKLF